MQVLAFLSHLGDLWRQMRWTYLPPLMVYLAAGISGLTGIVGTFYVKNYLGLSAEFLAMLGFWAGIPWALKMPLGHLVDLFWRWKAVFVFLGAGLIATSLGIMIGLLGYTDFMRSYLSVEVWFIISALLSPIGYVVQDVVADAMTVEAVPLTDDEGNDLPKSEIHSMHTTMQTLGRFAIVTGGILVSVLNLIMFADVEMMSATDKNAAYLQIYYIALAIPAVSVFGVFVSSFLKSRRLKTLIASGVSVQDAMRQVNYQEEKPAVNWIILGGSAVYAVTAIGLGLSDLKYSQEIIFAVSLGIIVFLISRLIKFLDPEARKILIATAVIIFMFRAMPGPGAGSSWWQIDVLGFDEQFLSILSVTASVIALFGMVLFRQMMAEKSIAYIMVFLSIVSTILTLPIIGMFYGLHEWTAIYTGGVVDARFIALVDTALESPLGQVAMIPMLAWIARAAPPELKATFFAVMASFTNLALSASQLGTRYMNQIYTVTREVKDEVTGLVTVPADYSELGMLLIAVTVLGFVLPVGTIMIIKAFKIKSA